MGSLIPVDDGPPAARCKLCGKTAVGPCARCRASVCGDCCELTEGGATTFAICLTCVKRGGKSLTGGWLGLIGWLGTIILGLVAIAAALFLASCGGGGRFATSGGTGSSSKVALANGYAYWADPFRGLARGRVDEPAAWSTLTRTGAGDANVHVNSSHVFWRANDEVRRVVKTGGAFDVVGKTVEGVAFNLAVDDTFLYYTRGETLVRHALADDTVTNLLDDRASTSLALAGDMLIGTTCAAGDAVWSMPADGSAPPRSLLAAGCPEVATVDDAFIYMFDLLDGRPGIVRVPLGGGEPVRLIESASSVFAVRDGALYAVDLENRVVRVPIAGGEPVVLLDEPVFGFAADDVHLYYTKRDVLAQLVLFSAPLP